MYKLKIAILDEAISGEIIQEKLLKLFRENDDFAIFQPEIVCFTDRTDDIEMRMKIKKSNFNLLMIGYHLLQMKKTESMIKFIKKQSAKQNFQIYFQERADWVSFNEDVSEALYRERQKIEEKILSENTVKEKPEESINDNDNEISIDTAITEDDQEDVEEAEEFNLSEDDDFEIVFDTDDIEEKAKREIRAVEEIIADDSFSVEEDLLVEKDEVEDIVDLQEKKKPSEETIAVEDNSEDISKRSTEEIDNCRDDDLDDDFEISLSDNEDLTEEQSIDFTKEVDIGTPDSSNEETLISDADQKIEKLYHIFKKEKQEVVYHDEMPLIRPDDSVDIKKEKTKPQLSNEEVLQKIEGFFNEKELQEEKDLLEDIEEPNFDQVYIIDDELNNNEPEEDIEEDISDFVIDDISEEAVEEKASGNKIKFPNLSNLKKITTILPKKIMSRENNALSSPLESLSIEGDFGFIGNMNGVGTSHIALSVATYFANEGRKVAFVDMKGDIAGILKEQDDLKFSIYDLNNYREAYQKSSIRIIDFGVINLDDKRALMEFERCRFRYIVGNMTELKGFGINKNLEYSIEPVEFYSVFNYTEETELEDFSRSFKELKVINFPFSKELGRLQSNIINTFR